MKSTLQRAASVKSVKLPEPQDSFMSRLQPADLLQLAHASLQSPLGCIHPGLTACMQALDCWSADDIIELLQVAVSKQDKAGAWAVASWRHDRKPSAKAIAEYTRLMLVISGSSPVRSFQVRRLWSRMLLQSAAQCGCQASSMCLGLTACSRCWPTLQWRSRSIC